MTKRNKNNFLAAQRKKAVNESLKSLCDFQKTLVIKRSQLQIESENNAPFFSASNHIGNGEKTIISRPTFESIEVKRITGSRELREIKRQLKERKKIFGF